MDKVFILIGVIFVILCQGVVSQFRFHDDFQVKKNYDSDYPDIIDYDDTRAATRLDRYLFNKQYARDDVNNEESYYDTENDYRSPEYGESPFKSLSDGTRDTQDYKESHAFLSKKPSPYGNLDMLDESSHTAIKKISQNLQQKSRNLVVEDRNRKHGHINRKKSEDSRVVNSLHETVKNRDRLKKVVDDTKKVTPVVKPALSKKEISSSQSSRGASSTQVLTGSVPQPKKVSSRKDNKELDDAFFVVVVAACSVAGVAGLALAGYCWYKLRKEGKDVTEGEIVGYSGNTGEKLKTNYGGNNGDEKLTKSAEMYHYLHAKKHLTAMDSNGKEGSTKRLHIHDASDTSDEESDNTVYECPGLAPPGDMKVVNPLFSDGESRHSDRHSDHHSDAKSEESASSSPPYRLGRSSISSASSKP